MNLGEEGVERIKLDLLRELSRWTMTEAQIEHAIRYVDTYLEHNASGTLQ